MSLMLKWLQMAYKQCVLFDYVGMSVVIHSCFCHSHEVQHSIFIYDGYLNNCWKGLYMHHDCVTLQWVGVIPFQNLNTSF